MGKLEGEVVLITGGGSGIGRATAILFAKEGAKLVVADYVIKGGEDTVGMIRKAGGEAIFVKADVSKAADVQKMIQVTLDKYGKLDILFNNAGIEGEEGNTHECTEENWDRTISINLKGVFLSMKYGIAAMLRQDGGVVINTGSAVGLVGRPGNPAYVASKGAVVQLTKAAALEYATQNIRVNCICPGMILTPMVERAANGSDEKMRQYAQTQPVGRMGKPEEVAQAALFLASSESSSFVTGTALPVDGGWVAG